MSGKITAALEAALAEGCNRFGEIAVARESDGFILTHHADRDRTGQLRLFTDPSDAIEISKHDGAGNYRPLKSAPSLPRGWELRLPDVASLRTALDFFYPAMLGLRAAHHEGRLQVVNFRETTRRQSGMYDVVKKISDQQADQLIGDFCKSDGKCIKTILWKIEPEKPVTTLPPAKFDPRADQLWLEGKSMPLLCNEACNLLIAAAPAMVKK